MVKIKKSMNNLLKKNKFLNLRIYKFEIQNMLLILSNARFVWAANAFLEQVVGIIFTVIAFNKVSLVNNVNKVNTCSTVNTLTYLDM